MTTDSPITYALTNSVKDEDEDESESKSGDNEEGGRGGERWHGKVQGGGRGIQRNNAK
jgi:hypothetical protein